MAYRYRVQVTDPTWPVRFAAGGQSHLTYIPEPDISISFACLHEPDS